MTDSLVVRVISIERERGAFQQPLTDGQVEAICTRTFGPGAVSQAVELGLGTYNTVYRLDLADRRAVLRVAPELARSGSEFDDGLRNEYAAAPYFVRLGRLVPSVLAADFTHDLVDRDYLVQSFLAGRPAPEVLPSYERPAWADFYRQLGTITRGIHDVRGLRFGPVVDPRSQTWGDALAAEFARSVQQYAQAGLDPAEVRQLADLVHVDRGLFDAVEPRLLHGDLWHVNILLADGAPIPTITGICDSDRASWGDPLADWTIGKVQQRIDNERDAFWETYGPLPTDADSRRRLLVYRARNLLGSRLDIHRRGLAIEEIPPIHWDLGPVLAELRASA